MCYQGLRGEEAIQTFCFNFATLGIKCLAFVSSEEFIKYVQSLYFILFYFIFRISFRLNQ